jgi:HK97 family phage portal protein
MNSSAITRAFARSSSSYCAAKSAVAATGSIFDRGASGGNIFNERADLSKAQEQLKHLCGWVFACIRPIATKIAGQPIRVSKKGAKLRGTKATQPEFLESHDLLDLLADPNDLMVGASLLDITVKSLELTGRSLWWLPKKKQIYPIPTDWIVNMEGKSQITGFKIRPKGNAQEITIPADDCCYFHYPHPADLHGAMSTLQAAAGAVDADESITRSQFTMFHRGIHPSHLVLVGTDKDGNRPRLSGSQQRSIISAIKKRYGGTVNAGEPLILDGLISDVKRISNTPAEMDWIESGKALKARICQIFGVNPIIMGEIEGANRASAYAAEKHFADWTVNPKIELISQVMTEWLSPMFGGDIIVWIEPVVADDEDLKRQWAMTLASYSAITGDELRELSPFNLKLGAFKEPVGKQPPAAKQHEAEIVKAMSSKLPDRIVERVANGILQDVYNLEPSSYSGPPEHNGRH